MVLKTFVKTGGCAFNEDHYMETQMSVNCYSLYELQGFVDNLTPVNKSAFVSQTNNRSRVPVNSHQITAQ